MAWVYVVLGVVLAAILVAGAYRFLKRRHQSMRAGSIHQLIESSRRHEDAGQFNRALIDLDTALKLADEIGPAGADRLKDQRKRRGDLARRDVQAVLDRLCAQEASEFPLGDWLNLIARVGADQDLVPLKPRIDDQFDLLLQRAVESNLGAARQAYAAGRVVTSLNLCERIPGLLKHLPSEQQAAPRSEAEQLATKLVATHGIVIESTQGVFLHGSHASYLSTMLPTIVKELEAKNYLPYRESSPWRAAWSHALYHLILDVSEHREGNYEGSENRLTRIFVTLTLSYRGDSIWYATPTARTTVPLPSLTQYQASRLAVPRERSAQLEKVLYDDARAQILGKLTYHLSHMPPWPGPL
jgi:hypothetical protein